MNQVTNLIQWKNLTQEQKDEFDFDYEYHYQGERENTVSWWIPHAGLCKIERVYRLVIEDDKWYWIEDDNGEQACLGEFINQKDITKALILRPARPDEIPQQERTLEQKIQDKWPDKEVELLKWHSKHGSKRRWVGSFGLHTKAQSIEGFAGYVYDFDHGLDFSAMPCAETDIIIQPVAVLFERSEG